MSTTIGQAVAHKFRIGQKVDVMAQKLERFMRNGPFEVTEQFHHRGEPFYSVKSPHEPYERVLAESRLCAFGPAWSDRTYAPVQSA